MSLNLNSLLADLEANSSALEKSAADTTTVAPAVADEFASVLTKKAEQDLTKEAHAQGELLAKQLLEKFANQIIVNDGENKAEDDTKVVATAPGVVEDVLKATVEEGLDRGATSEDRVDAKVDEGMGSPSGDPLPADGNQLINKEAEMSNKSIAQYILQKLAEENGAPVGTAGSTAEAPNAAPVNQIQINDVANVAADDAKVLPLPATEGTISNILDAIVARAKAQGAGSDDLVNSDTGVTPAQRDDEAVEKAAAVSALVGEGMDFEMAVDLVKQAEAELKVDAFEQEKQAALGTLMEAGVDFDSAVALIKQAEEDLKVNFNQGTIDKEAGLVDGALKATINAGKSLGASAKAAKPALKTLATGKAPAGSLITPGAGSNRAIAGKALLKNRAVQAGAGAAALGATVLGSGSREKQAKEVTDAQAWKATGKAYGRSTLEGIGGSFGGAAIAGALTHNPVAAVGGAALGATLGTLHGAKASIKNSLKKQTEKKAAFDALIESGIDFEKAAELVTEASKAVYGE